MESSSPHASTVALAQPSHPRTHAGTRETAFVDVTKEIEDELRNGCDVISMDQNRLDEVNRDWWPLALTWAKYGAIAGTATVVASPTTIAEIQHVLRVANMHGVAVTPIGERSGVNGGSTSSAGGIALDLTHLEPRFELDHDALVVDVSSSMNGAAYERTLREQFALTGGHFPQSIEMSTVGGWLACRSAGQFSTRYGKIEDLVESVTVVLASGEVIDTAPRSPRGALGPDLTQLFVGSEGSLGVITSARLRVFPLPEITQRRAYLPSSFTEGLTICRQILQHGAKPALLRLYDEVEAQRHFEIETPVLLVYDEGTRASVDGAMRSVEEIAHQRNVSSGDVELVNHWFDTRNDVSALGRYISQGAVVDTIEIAAGWGALASIYREARDGLLAIPGMVAASAHQSHSYENGACLYFTFGGLPSGVTGTSENDLDVIDQWYRQAWKSVLDVVIKYNGAISHHHGVGRNRIDAFQTSSPERFAVLRTLKNALDPQGIMNPGVFGL